MAPKEEVKGDAMTLMIEECIVPRGSGVKWTDIQGLDDVKKTLMEAIIYP
jgi:SpoVK/Ycf46/Vps4 family AAA+-type ATPase